MSIKNNVTRFLDSKNINHKVHTSNIEKRSAIETADLLGVAAELVYKTIVALRPKGGKSILAIIPGPRNLDLKSVAKFYGEKKIVLATHAEAEKVTGLQTGGISPLALINKGFQLLIDSSAKDYSEIYISGGQRGLTISIDPEDLMTLTNAKLVSIAK